MKPLVWMLVALLVGSNAFWVWWTRGREAPVAPAARDDRPETAAGIDLRRGEHTARRRAEAARVRTRVRRIEDDDERRDALDRLAKTLEEGEVADLRVALRVLHQIKNVEYDRERFRRLLLPLLESEDASVRRSVLLALPAVTMEPGDLDQVIRAVRAAPAADRQQLAQVMLRYNGGRADGDVADVFLEFLGSEDAQAAVAAAGALRGALVTEEVERAVIDLWQRSRGTENGILYVIAQVRPRREPMVATLLEELTMEDAHRLHSVVQDALRGEIEEEARPYLVERIGRLLPTTSSPATQRTFLEVLEEHGTAAQAEVVVDLAANELVDAAVRKEAERVGRLLAQRR